jgi:uncharacterized protein YgbK (DUF1537 family)
MDQRPCLNPHPTEGALVKTVVLDDDPTGTQSASGVTVVLEPDHILLEAALRDADSVYVLTNSRAVDEQAARALVTRIRDLSEEIVARLGEQVQFVLRGDSTLRGHVFAESEVFLDDDAVLLFVPAFPAGGRVTIGGVHYVTVDGHRVPAADTEFAADPVFPFRTSVLVDYVAEKSGRAAVGLELAAVRAGELSSLLIDARPGSVVVPDAEDDDDIRMIAGAVTEARAAGRTIVVRSASPLAAVLAGVASTGLLATPLLSAPVPTLVVCGSHTAAASAQLDEIADRHRGVLLIDTAVALTDPSRAGTEAGAAAAERLTADGVAVITSERARAADHNTLGHGERVMTALTTAAATALPFAGVVVAKGGITSADVARIGLGITTAVVLGQVLHGVSVWRGTVRDGRELLYVVVPGNVGGADTLSRVLDALAVPQRAAGLPSD